MTPRNVRRRGLKAPAGSTAMLKLPVPGIAGSWVNCVSPGTKVRGAQLFPPWVEKEKPQPSLKSKSFHEAANRAPSGRIPADSSLSAKASAVTSMGWETGGRVPEPGGVSLDAGGAPAEG